MGFKHLPPSYSFFGYASLLLFVLNSTFISMNRFVLPIFPIYLLLLEKWLADRETAYSLVLAVSASALGLLLTLFSNGFWTG